MGEARTSAAAAKVANGGPHGIDRLRLLVAQQEREQNVVTKVAGEDADSINFAAAANKVAAVGVERGQSVSERLLRKFGLGTDPRRRRELFHRVQLVVEKHGDVALEVVSAVVADAVGKNKPAHWFCRSILNRFRDRGLLLAGVAGDPTW